MHALLFGSTLLAPTALADDQCTFNIVATGHYYGTYPFTYEDSCDTTFEHQSFADSAENGYNCGSRFGLQTAVLLTNDGTTVGLLSCANQGFNIAVTKTRDYEHADPNNPECTSGSTYTEKMLAKMDTAQADFAKCDSDIWAISGSLTRVKYAASAVDKASEGMDMALDRIDDIMDRVIKSPPQGLGLADMLGKIPKVGIFVKLGMKASAKVVDGLEPLTDLIAKWGDRIHEAVKIGDATFMGLKVVSGGTSTYLEGSHMVLEAAHNCAQATTGYKCGSKGAQLEAQNENNYPTAAPQLDDIALVGRTCHDVLSPVDALMREMAEVAEAIAKLLQPINDFLDAVEDFLVEMEKQIQAFLDALTDGAAAQCALEIFEPVTDVVNLVTCPIDEAAGALMHFVVDQMTFRLDDLIKAAFNYGITEAVDAMVADDLEIYIPDFTAVIPAEFWYDVCEDAALAFPGLPQAIQQFTSLPLPYHMTGKELESAILSQALFETDLSADLGGYDSACVEAWKEMGTDFANCQKVLDDIADAAELAACESAKTAHEANEVLVNGAQAVFNEANSHFKSAQDDFTAANNHLQKVKKDLEDAIQAVENEKSKCPSCTCGGCSWSDVSCHLESAWCCPARHTCLLALDIASASVGLARETVSIAEAAVDAASATYYAASSALTAASNELNYYKGLASQSEAAVNQACKRRRVDFTSRLTARIQLAQLEGLGAPTAA